MNNYTNKILVATSKMTDRAYAGKTVFIREQRPEGSYGFLLNGDNAGRVGFGMVDEPEDLPTSKKDLDRQMDDGILNSVEIHLGGPYETNPYMIHSYPEFFGKPMDYECLPVMNYTTPKSFEVPPEDLVKNNTIIPGLYFGSPDIFIHIVMNKKQNENKFKFMIGESIWENDLLDIEVQLGLWQVLDEEPKPEMFFNLNSSASAKPKKRDNRTYFNFSKN